MKKLFIYSFLLVISVVTSNAQEKILSNVKLTNIGPTIMSGRVVDIAVNPENPIEFYVAYASGGLWHTSNNGTTFTCITDNAPTQNTGAVAVDWTNKTIWLGTGESNSSRSSYAGVGILMSNDNGKTWHHKGLNDSHHISKIIINSKNPNEVIVGVVGHLYSKNEERGVYKTTDGGNTWSKVLYVNDETGAIDVVVTPTNENVVYAAMWERERKAWDFKGDGENSGIYKSTDFGATWTKMSTEKSGFPTGDGVGRIGLAAFNENIVYAFLDNQNLRPSKKKEETGGLTIDYFRNISKEDFLAIDNEKLSSFFTKNSFDKKYTAKKVKEMVMNNEITPQDIVKYLEDANYVLLNSEVIGAELYKSEDGGLHWEKTHKEYLDDVYSSYGYYFGLVRVNESNVNKVYIAGVPLLKSDDGGKTFTSINEDNVHADHHSLWVNPKLQGHLINGNDGGINISFDDGASWSKNNAPSVGQFYAINVDNKKNYNVYGGLQDNGVWAGPSNYTFSTEWQASGHYPYEMIGGGDGMQVQVDTRTNDLVYSGSQFGYYYRLNTHTKERIQIHPKHELGDSPYRYNWQTPILLSKHNQDILYMGANKLLRSMDQGVSFEAISGDLTTGGKKGNVPYGTLTTISESPFQFGFLYVGSDDGYIHFSPNGGSSWEKISNDLPQDLWVSRVVASKHTKSRVYATLNGYRNDDFAPYVYVSENNGKQWKSISANLPKSPVNVIIEDTLDESILYVGTDDGVYISFNKGNSWEPISDLPKVAVHDLVIQEREKELIIGTHGRSIYKVSINELQQFNAIKNNDLHLFELSNLRFSRNWGSNWSKWLSAYEPTLHVTFYSNSAGKYTIEILSENGTKLKQFDVDAVKGFNFTTYDVSVDDKSVKSYFSKNNIEISKAKNNKYYLVKGKYTLKLSNKSASKEKQFEIK